jgi:hypothetical protein
MDQQGGTVVVCLGLHVVFVLKEEPDNTNVYLQLFLIRYGSISEGI